MLDIIGTIVTAISNFFVEGLGIITGSIVGGGEGAPTL